MTSFSENTKIIAQMLRKRFVLTGYTDWFGTAPEPWSEFEVGLVPLIIYTLIKTVEKQVAFIDAEVPPRIHQKFVEDKVNMAVLLETFLKATDLDKEEQATIQKMPGIWAASFEEFMDSSKDFIFRVDEMGKTRKRMLRMVRPMLFNVYFSNSDKCNLCYFQDEPEEEDESPNAKKALLVSPALEETDL